MKSVMTLLREAKATLKGRWGMAIVLLLLYGLIDLMCQEIPITAIFVSFPIAFGVTRAFLLFSREGKALRVNDLFSAFNRKYYWKGVVAYLLMGIFTFLWLLLFIIPGIIKMLAYSLTPYILADNPELSAKQALNKSVEMMNGHKARLFRFYLLYWVAAIGSSCLAWVPMIWLAPLFEVTRAKFYEDVKSVQKPVAVLTEA